jgi:hypothetical protein
MPLIEQTPRSPRRRGADDPLGEHDIWERANIMHFDGGIPMEEAERKARAALAEKAEDAEGEL